MIPSIHAALNAVLGNVAALQHANGAGRAFELFVMTAIARELQVRGYDVWLQRSDGTRIAPGNANRNFVQRGGAPTGVASAANGNSNPSVIGFRWPHRSAWEIWNGVQFEGRSGALHEIDLAIVPASVGNHLRAIPMGGCPTGRPRVSIECKDVGQAGSLDEMRAFVARLYDLTLLYAHHSYLPFGPLRQAIHPAAPVGPLHSAVFTYWQENHRTLNVIARRTGFVHGTAALTGYHVIEPHGGIVVGSPNITGLVTRVVSWLFNRGY